MIFSAPLTRQDASSEFICPAGTAGTWMKPIFLPGQWRILLQTFRETGERMHCDRSHKM